VARSNVVSASRLGWCQVFVGGHAKGWSYRYELRLECGHTKTFVSEPFVNRVQDVPAPAWVECRECER